MSQSLSEEKKVETKSNDEEQRVEQDTQSSAGTTDQSIIDSEPVNLHQLQTPIAFNVISAPKVCPPGYRMDATGKCRKIM